MSLAALLALLALVVVAVVGCSDDDASGAGSPPDEELVEGVELDVLTVDNYFRPEDVSVEAGTEVVWTNKGQTAHNILPVDQGDFLAEAEDLQPGDVYRYRFTEPGIYPYYCSLHGNEEVGMVGTIEVTAP